MVHIWIVLFVLTACKATPPDISPQNEIKHPELPAEKLRQKISIKLRNGRPLEADEEKNFAKLSNKSLALRMMESREFIDTVFQFNLFVLGMDSPHFSYRFNNNLGYRASFYSAAVHSAQNVGLGGSYLDLLAPIHPFYVQPSPLTSAEYEERLTKLRESLDTSINALNAGISTTDFCKLKANDDIEAIADELDPGVGIFFLRRFSFIAYIAKSSDLCRTRDNSIIPDDDVEEMETLAQSAFETLSSLRFLAKDQYKPQSVADIRAIPLERFDLHVEDERAIRQAWFWLSLRNSSTNYNRKRASYILKRLMCDDLTPIAVDTPSIHAEDEHGSQASCVACHYKLDPIAGYFREYGAFGLRQNPNLPPLFSGFSSPEEVIYFDDFAFKPWAEYVEHWSKPEQIGIIRSTTSKDANIYAHGERGPSELFESLKSHPDVHQCLVKKSLQFFVDKDLTIDSALLKQFSHDFSRTVEKKGSTLALKELITRIVTTKSFAQTSVTPGLCYDRTTPSAVPCSIAGIIDEYCTSCHNSQRATSGLDLSTWDDLGTPVFIDSNGIQRSQEDAFQRIAQALNTDNTQLRMPLGKVMSAQDRDSLFRFFSRGEP